MISDELSSLFTSLLQEPTLSPTARRLLCDFAVLVTQVRALELSADRLTVLQSALSVLLASVN